MSDRFYRNILGIGWNPKGIPYAGGKRTDGSTNHGFMNPKRMSQEELLAIPEVVGDRGFEYMIPKLNLGKTGFLTIGCEKSHNAEVKSTEETFWSKSYVEFAFNHRGMVLDASSYFPLFFQFNEYMRPVTDGKDFFYLWDIAANSWDDVDNKQAAFSVTVWLTVHGQTSQENAHERWYHAWKWLTDFMINWVGEVHPQTPLIYSPQDG